MSENMIKAIDAMYENRQEFLIIGLTGRTGSGCTTAANILGSEKDTILNVIENKKSQLEKEIQISKGNADDNLRLINERYDLKSNIRELSIIGKHIGDKWKPLKVIRGIDIISMFILEYPKEDFKKYLLKSLGSLDAVLKIKLMIIKNYGKMQSNLKVF